jgi:hypothetical protein
MPQSNYVFIRYSRQDQEAAERLIANLNGSGIQIWRDIKQIEPSTQQQVQILSTFGPVGVSATLTL